MMKRLSVCLLTLSLALQGVQAAELIGKIESVKGEAFLAHLLKKKQVAAVGDEVYEKDKVRTGADGEVVIALADSKLTIGPNAYTKISNESKDASSTKLALYGGTVGFKVNKLSAEKSFTVRTPSAVAGVRGTEGAMSFDYGSGVTGTSSIPHTQDGGDPSIVYTSTPENEEAMKGAIRESRMNEENGLPEPMPNENVNILPEGFASVHLPDGETFVIENTEGLGIDDLSEKVQSDKKKGDVASSFGNRAAMSAEQWADYLEDLENRIDFIEEAKGNLSLPGAPETPSVND